jgi:hypothetical protein
MLGLGVAGVQIENGTQSRFRGRPIASLLQ